MSDFFTTFASSVPPWLLPLVILVYFWGKFVKAGLNPEQKSSFKRTLGWLKQDNVGQLYLTVLGWFMDKVSDWIGDRHNLTLAYQADTSSRGLATIIFGFNPFTAKSYEKCLLLASIYPILFFLSVWAFGGEARIGSVSFFGDDEHNLVSVTQRMLLLGGLFSTLVISFWLLYIYKKRNQLLLLGLIFGIFTLVIMLVVASMRAFWITYLGFLGGHIYLCTDLYWWLDQRANILWL